MIWFLITINKVILSKEQHTATQIIFFNLLIAVHDVTDRLYHFLDITNKLRSEVLAYESEKNLDLAVHKKENIREQVILSLILNLTMIEANYLVNKVEGIFSRVIDKNDLVLLI